MENYFEIIELCEGTWQIYEPGDVGSVLIEGSEAAMLIDTGYGFENLKAEVRKLTDKPLIVVNTHGHTDHTGGNMFFDEVWINKEDMPSYDDYQHIQKPLVAARFEGTRKAAGKPMLWPKDFDRMAWYQAGTKRFLWLKDGQIFDLGGGHQIEAIFIPGHTEGSVMFFDQLTGVLYSGDNLAYSLWMQFPQSASLTDYKEGLKKLKGLGIQKICSGHQRGLYSAWLVDAMPKIIDRVSVAKSRRFFHPRTGQPGWLYREKVSADCPEGAKTVFITFQEDRM